MIDFDFHRALWRRWWYLLWQGAWRGECAINVRNRYGRIEILASGQPPHGTHWNLRVKGTRIWWPPAAASTLPMRHGD